MPKTRLIVAAIVCMAFLGGALAATAIAQSQRFSDVPPDAYYHDAAIWADNAGITTGCEDGTKFCPDDNLTRAHMITFLKRYEDWTQRGRPNRNATGPGAGLACLSHEDGCDITLEALGIPEDTVLIVGVHIAPGRWHIPDCARFAFLNEDIKTHPSYPGPGEHWQRWIDDLKSVPGHGYDGFQSSGRHWRVEFSENTHAFIYRSFQTSVRC